MPETGEQMMEIDNLEVIYGALLGLQITSAITVLWNVWIGFGMLMIACFGKGMLFQYTHSCQKQEKR